MAKGPIQLKVEIPAASMKKIADAGRLTEFVATFPAVAAGEIAKQIVEAIAHQHASGLGFTVGFDDGDEFRTGPPHIKIPHKFDATFAKNITLPIAKS